MVQHGQTSWQRLKSGIAIKIYCKYSVCTPGSRMV